MNVHQLNNIAISLFQRGYHDDAVLCLKAAIDVLVRDIRNQPADNVQTTTDPMDWSHNQPSCCSYTDEMDQCRHLQMRHATANCFMYPVPIGKPSTSCEDDSSSSMYSYAVVLSCIPPNGSSMECRLDQVSVVLLYNLAFINHWRAVHLGNFSSLSKALKLYEMAAIVVTEIRVANVESLSLAIWNNMGHIHVQLFQLDGARECFSNLRQILQHRHDIRQCVQKSDIDFFLLSVISQGWEVHSAPAA